VTLLVSDGAGSTAMGETLDPESRREVMGRYFAVMSAAIERHGGTVEKFIGDAVMAVFGVPAVHEDDALRAVRAADELRRGLDELNDELEACPHRSLGIVLACRRRTPQGHDRVADELLDGAAVALDHLTRSVEVAGEKLAHLLRVAVLGKRREADQVAEEDGYQPPLRHRRRNRNRRPGGIERRAAVAAKTVVRLVCRAARGTAVRERGTAVRAEHPPDSVLGSTR
jgi:hypothetical protein